ncbi:MAG: hypothetical protein NW223_19260 [Hyphomicrobiaceae bacterium]|nr:hypothetical protein [Hyphomicrobiaceae bacterium]
MQPAAIEPVWRDGRLTLPREPVAGDLDKPDLDAALQALKQLMQSVADAAKKEGNVDRRAVAHLNDLAAKIPETAPPQLELFGLGHDLAGLQGYAATVSAEWPPLLASRFHALTLAFDDTMRQFSVWRTYKRNPSKDTLAPAQISSAPELAHAVADELRNDEGKEFTAAPLADAIDALADSGSHPSQPPLQLLERAQEELARDVLESLNNVLKRIAAAALQAWELLPERERASLHKSAGGFRDQANKHIENCGPKLADFAAKWLRRAAKASFAWGTAKAAGLATGLLGKLIELHPMFEWLGPILRLFI